MGSCLSYSLVTDSDVFLAETCAEMVRTEASQAEAGLQREMCEGRRLAEVLKNAGDGPERDVRLSMARLAASQNEEHVRILRHEVDTLNAVLLKLTRSTCAVRRAMLISATQRISSRFNSRVAENGVYIPERMDLVFEEAASSAAAASPSYETSAPSDEVMR